MTPEENGTGGDMTSRYPEAEPIELPKEIVFIDEVVLDEELQLIREEFFEDMRPIEVAWKAFEPRATWPQALPMRIFKPLPWQRLNHLQLAFITHVVFHGETESGFHLDFKTALELFRDEYGTRTPASVTESLNFMRELRAVA